MREDDTIRAIEDALPERRLVDLYSSSRVHFYIPEPGRQRWFRTIVEFGEDPAVIVHAMIWPGPLPRLELHEP